ncbi:MAG: hypothetical protein DMF79_19960 [Acidobacteria bacterium]|nr:MAG: hypothetical protein DMF79_19960 [Acidobacteriota bacterium]
MQGRTDWRKNYYAGSSGFADIPRRGAGTPRGTRTTQVVSRAKKGRLLPNGTLEVAQQVGFFSSSLYPDSWDAVTTVELTYPSGEGG